MIQSYCSSCRCPSSYRQRGRQGYRDRFAALLFCVVFGHVIKCAPCISKTNYAYVILNDGDRGIIVPPGASGTKICLRLLDAEGNQSGPVKKVPATELRLEELPAPPAPLRLAPWCVNYGSVASMKCAARGGRSTEDYRRWRLGRTVLGVSMTSASLFYWLLFPLAFIAWVGADRDGDGTSRNLRAGSAVRYACWTCPLVITSSICCTSNTPSRAALQAHRSAITANKRPASTPEIAHRRLCARLRFRPPLRL